MAAALAVAIGGGIGALARWWMAAWVTRLLGAGFPWGTLAVNVLGGFLMGAIVQAATHVWPPSTPVRLFLTITARSRRLRLLQRIRRMREDLAQPLPVGDEGPASD
jgi:hypothetical protein